MQRQNRAQYVLEGIKKENTKKLHPPKHDNISIGQSGADFKAKMSSKTVDCEAENAL